MRGRGRWTKWELRGELGWQAKWARWKEAEWRVRRELRRELRREVRRELEA